MIPARAIYGINRIPFFRRSGTFFIVPCMHRLLLLLAAALALSVPPAFADSQNANGAAHPAFWVVHGSKGTAYILSSVHALPDDVVWHRPEIDTAIKASDTFIFEVPSSTDDEAEATRFIMDRGRLPEGQTLESLLTPAAQKDYAQACALAGMQTASLDDKRPWLAAVVLTVEYMNQRHLTSTNAPDEELMTQALKYGKSVRYFDTTREQLEFLARFDTTMGINGFSTMLDDFPNQPQREDALIGAWRRGDTGALAQMIDAYFSSDPDGRRIIDARNKVWAGRLESMLDEDRVYFITVGVAHLVGPSGMPALLRADGYKVDGP